MLGEHGNIQIAALALRPVRIEIRLEFCNKLYSSGLRRKPTTCLETQRIFI
jgi:hypothetical protein